MDEPPPRFTPDEKERVFERNRRLLEEDLARGDLTFASRPFKVDLQLSNFCNMSCAMCYDGANPPLEKMSPRVVRKVAEEILPTASVVVPFVGGEPLILTWDTARDLAREFALEMEIDTNVQFLDETKFHELEPFVTTIVFSIDTHVPEIYERIRLRGNREKVFRNLPVAARLCRDHGIEVIVNAVFLTLNAPHLHDTVAFMADQGVPSFRVVPYLPLLKHRSDLDPMASLSPAQILEIKARCVDAARRKAMRLLWDVGGYEDFDFRTERISRPGKHHDHGWLTKLNRYLPGFCTQSVYRVSVHADGRVYPCCIAGGDVLVLGNLESETFEAIWNNPTSRDLRRAMLTGDVPKFCKGCGFHTKLLPPAENLPFVEALAARVGPVPARPTLGIQGPDHMARARRPFTIRWARPEAPVDRYVVALALGGETFHVGEFTPPGDARSFRIPSAFWEAMKANCGYWWTVWGIRDGDPAASVRTPEMRCLVRREPIRRIRGSTLEY